jgi:hypothetical protein
LGAVLKTAPPDVVKQAAGWLRLGGWIDVDGLLPPHDERGARS